MLNILRKIIYTGTVTENLLTSPVPEKFRGAVAVKATGCADCRSCAKACPTSAIKITDGLLAIDNKACIFCGHCVEKCQASELEHTKNYKLASLAGSLDETAGGDLKRKIRQILGRSLHIRHVDVGSCNACDFEMSALHNPVYDLQQYGIDFVASPRHADMLMVTGVVTRNLTQALMMTYEATPAPKLVMAIGSCAASGRIFGDSYAIRGGADAIVPVDIYVPGCPPRPDAISYGLMLALDRL